MIGTGGVSANTYGTDELLVFVVKSEAAAEDVDAADLAADHWVVGLTVVFGVAAISYVGVNGIAELEAEEGATGLSVKQLEGETLGDSTTTTFSDLFVSSNARRWLSPPTCMVDIGGWT